LLLSSEKGKAVRPSGVFCVEAVVHPPEIRVGAKGIIAASRRREPADQSESHPALVTRDGPRERPGLQEAHRLLSHGSRKGSLLYDDPMLDGFDLPQGYQVSCHGM
jgi:hypothetical protein